MRYLLVALLLIGCKHHYSQRPPILFKNGDTALSFTDSSIFIHQGVGSTSSNDISGFHITAWNNNHTDTVYYSEDKIDKKDDIDVLGLRIDQARILLDSLAKLENKQDSVKRQLIRGSFRAGWITCYNHDQPIKTPTIQFRKDSIAFEKIIP